MMTTGVILMHLSKTPSEPKSDAADTQIPPDEKVSRADRDVMPRLT